MENQLLVGFHKEKVTPPLGVRLPGYYYERVSDGVITDLYMHATVFCQGEQKAVIFSVDSIGNTVEGSALIKKTIAEKFGFEEQAIYIHSTHSHTAFRVSAPTEDGSEIEKLHRQWLIHKFCDCVFFALQDAKPATIKVASGEAKGVGFLRNYRMKDGSCMNSPPFGSEDIVSFIGQQDNSLQLVRILREDAPEILMINFGTHADVIGGTLFCADWPGYTRDTVRGALNTDVEIMMLVGPEGNSNHNNRFMPKEEVIKGVPMSQKMARILSGEVLRIYDSAKEIPTAEIRCGERMVTVGTNPFDPADIPEARKVYGIYKELGTTRDPIFKTFNLTVPAARRICRLLDGNFTSFELRVSALRIGELAFVGFSGEPFCEIGLDVKAASPYRMTFCTCITNGGQGYFPTATAFAEKKGYERSTSLYAHDVAKKLADAAIELLQELK